MGSVVSPTDEVTVDGEPQHSGFPAWVGGTWERADVLRYGENPHQRAALYTRGDGVTGLAQAEQLHGKAMSYNNYVDADAAWRAAWDHEGPAVAIIKHANPCGIAVGADIAEAHARAHATDPVSAYGGVIAANRRDHGGRRRGRSPRCSPRSSWRPASSRRRWRSSRPRRTSGCSWSRRRRPAPSETRPISGGLLMQATDRFQADGDAPENWTLATGEAASPEVLADLAFAWKAVRAAKSNAILLAKDGAAVGIGMGQVNRVDSCRLSVERANTLADGVGAGPRRRRGVRRVLPVRGRPPGAARRRGHRRRAAGRLDPRRGGRQGRRGGRRHDVPDGHPPLRALTRRGVLELDRRVQRAVQVDLQRHPAVHQLAHLAHLARGVDQQHARTVATRWPSGVRRGCRSSAFSR